MLFDRHEHHELPDGQSVTGEPLDGILWAHIFIMSIAFGLLFPIGLVCGLAKSRFHVPVQITAGALAILGYILGHAHKGRQFSPGAHQTFGAILMPIIIAQVAMGVVLKLHVEKGLLGKVRAIIAKLHAILGILIPVLSWVQIGFGVITIPGWCRKDHLGQCLAHGIMGSSFILYGYILTIMLFVGEGYLTRHNRSQEFYDSLIITIWGIVNTFTEHKPGEAWTHSSMQHTSMGVLWWCAGMVGLLLSYDWVNKKPRRNHIPAAVLIFTGFAMAKHNQHLMVSTNVHKFFGYCLMGAGLTRIIEISFVANDNPHQGSYIKTWQYLPPFLLVESGILFMGAQEEQMALLDSLGIMDASYVLGITSIAFLLFLWILFMINLYMILRGGSSHQQGTSFNTGSTPMTYRQPVQTTTGGIEMQPFLTEEEQDELDLQHEEHSLDFEAERLRG